MKTRLAVLAALASAAVSFGAGADPGPSISPPTVPAGTTPSLFPSEQGAFKAVEVASQVVESVIVQRGCSPKSFPFTVGTDSYGNGTATLGDANTGTVNLNSAFLASNAQLGRRYRVTGSGSLTGLQVNDITGNGSYNIGSTNQELSTNLRVQSPSNPAVFDPFYGTVIKNWWLLNDLQPIPTGFVDEGSPVQTRWDWGYQQISKKGYVNSKYWQESRFWRQDGFNAGTWWKKTRVTPAGCAIEVKIQAYGVNPADDISGFNESGTIAILGVNPGPFAK